MSTAQDLPLGDPAAFGAPVEAPPALRLVPTVPLDFDDAVSRVRPRLHRYAIRRLGDTHEAEELVQEALLRAYTHREQLLTEEDLSAWTTVVTGRLVIDRLRVRGRSTSVADVPEGARVGRDTADVVVARDEARTALDALDAMPARQAALLWAREVEGHSYEELCTRFTMTEPAVRSVLTRARKALRKEYALRGGTLPVGGLAVLAPWIASLTLADKLRRVATRTGAPAALGAIGITALGGLILSPFGLAPNHTDATYNPSRAVVSGTAAQPQAVGAVAAAVTKALAPAPARRSTGAALPTSTTSAAPQTILPLQHTCLATAPQARPAWLTVGNIGIGPYQSSAGSSHCAAAQAVKGSTLSFGKPLPANATGIRSVSIVSSDLDCSVLPQLVILTCSSEPSRTTSNPGSKK